MRHAGPVRREIGIRTIFNLLGPLANPAGAMRQLIGVYDGKLAPIFAQILLDLGSRHVMVVHGSDGLDEITLTGPTLIAEGREGKVRTYQIVPEELGLERVAMEDLLGGAVEENAAIIRNIMAGIKGPKRTIAELNAAAALLVADRAANMTEGLSRARRSVESGAAARALENLIRVSNEGTAESADA
jgi:anthranilate phosphoribosyltransferase